MVNTAARRGRRRRRSNGRRTAVRTGRACTSPAAASLAFTWKPDGQGELRWHAVQKRACPRVQRDGGHGFNGRRRVVGDGRVAVQPAVHSSPIRWLPEQRNYSARAAQEIELSLPLSLSLTHVSIIGNCNACTMCRSAVRRRTHGVVYYYVGRGTNKWASASVLGPIKGFPHAASSRASRHSAVARLAI
jgi:hypothetical protein